MVQHLERLIQTVQETELVERLMAANSLEEKIKICAEAMASHEFQEFIGHYDMVDANLTDDNIISLDDFICTKENAVAIATIITICRLDEQKLFDDEGYEAFINALREVEGPQNQVAEKLLRIIEPLYELSLDEVIEEIF